MEVLRRDVGICIAAVLILATILLPGLRSELTDGPGSPLDAWLAEDGLTRLKSWLEAVVTRPSCVDSLPPPEEVVSGYTKLLERIKAMASK